MKTRFCVSFLMSFILLSISIFSAAQIKDVEQVSFFSSRIKNPIVVEIKSDADNLYLIANNKSLYPYVLEIQFGDFRNLSPRVFDKTTVLLPGPNRIFTFKIVNKDEAPAITYKSKYYLSNIISTDEKFNPYLVPTGKNKIVKFMEVKENGSTKVYIDQFFMNPGDTVFCARKGAVTALPDNLDEVDRIRSSSLEVRHDDGTIAVYLGLSSEVMMVKLGQKVYPGQPIGIAGSSKTLIFRVYEIKDEGKIASIDILFAAADNKQLTSLNIRGLKTVFPDEIIKKEMTKKEISKYSKKSLF